MAETTKRTIIDDLLQRLQANQVEFDYDEGADVLYLSVGAPRPSISEPAGHGMVVRYTPETTEITGVTYDGFEQRFLPHYPELRALAEVVLSNEASDAERQAAATAILRRSVDLLPADFFTVLTGEDAEEASRLDDVLKDLQVWVDSLADEGVRRLVTEIPIIVGETFAAYGPLVPALQSARTAAADLPTFRARGITGEVQFLKLPDLRANVAISLAVGPASENKTSLAVRTETIHPPTALPHTSVILRDRQHTTLERLPAGPDGTAVFTNLGAGEYIFNVKHEQRTWEFPVSLMLADSDH